MSNITRRDSHLSLAERVRANLNRNSSAPSHGRVLLLDVSGSMAEGCGDGRTKIEALREVARDVACPATWGYADVPFRVHDVHSLIPSGTTMLGLAIETVRREGADHIAIITDGMPTDPERALRAVTGLRIDIFYVGPLPAPVFLAQLARAAAAGSSQQSGSLARQKELSHRVKALLMLAANTERQA